MIRELALAVGLLLAAPAAAAISPKPGPEDPRIQTVQYDAEQVVSLGVAPGYALTLEFAPDERIENVAIGNSGAWLVTPNKTADHLFIKPNQGAVETDMTVITDARTYNFELRALPGPDPSMAYTVRFLYAAAPASVEQQASTANVVYRFSGVKSLHPTEMSDDGRSTSILWPAKARIPAVYLVDAEGHEALVNGSLRNGRFVIDEIANEFIFRLGDQEARMTRHVVKERRQ